MPKHRMISTLLALGDLHERGGRGGGELSHKSAATPFPNSLFPSRKHFLHCNRETAAGL